MKERRIRLVSLFTVLFIIFNVISVPVKVQAQAEKETVKVGFFPLNGFYERDEQGNLSGYGVEYMEKIAAQARWNYEYVFADSWEEALNMLEDGKIDLLCPAERTKERESKFEFSCFPIGNECGALLTLDTNKKLTFEDFSSLNDIRVGYVNSIIFNSSFQKYEQLHNFHVNLVSYKDTPALVSALNAGQVDAILVNLMVKTDTMKVLGKFGAAPYYYIVNPNQSQLLEELNDAIQTFSIHNPSYQNKLTEKYFIDLSQEPFTKREIDFIQQAEPIHVGLTDHNAPFSVYKNGQFSGIDVEILKRIEEISGLQFTYEMLSTDTVSYQYLKEHKINLVADVEDNSVNQSTSGLYLSEPYIDIGKVFVGKKGKEYDMDSPLKMAVSSASGTLQQVLNMEYPNYEISTFHTTEDGLDAVKDGKADIYLQANYTVSLYMSNPHYSELIILPISGVATAYSFSAIEGVIGKENAEIIISIINKSIAQISSANRAEIITSQVVKNQYKYTWLDLIYKNRVSIGIVIVLLLIGVALLLYVVRQRLKTARAIRESEKKLSYITNNINGGVIVVNADAQLSIIYANEGFRNILGCSKEDIESIYNGSYLACVHPDDVERVKELNQKDVETDQKISFDLRIQRKDGTYVKTLFSGTLSEQEDGKREVYCVIVDMTKQAELMNQLELEMKRSNLIFEKTEDVIYEVDIEQKSIYTSKMLYRKYGWTFPEKVDSYDGKQFLEMWKIVEEDKLVLKQAIQKMLEEETVVSCRIRLYDRNQKEIWCEVFQYPIKVDEGKVCSIVGKIVDISMEMQEQERLKKMAQMDQLTGLYKKETFADLVMKDLDRNTQNMNALLFVDLDHFKQVNDTLGHMVGDKAIQDAAKKLQIIFSQYDIISRFGGDEFCVYIKDIPHETLVRKLDWMIEKLKETYSNGEKSVSISCSIGVACTEDIGNQYLQLIESADKALYKAKENGRAQYVFAK